MIFGLGFLITENNARYLLNGYNAMTEAERENFDLKAYISFFRTFHIRLAVSLFLIGLAISRFSSETWLAMFLAGYPVLAYMYMIKASNGFNFPERFQKLNNAGVVILGLTLVFVMLLVYLLG